MPHSAQDEDSLMAASLAAMSTGFGTASSLTAALLYVISVVMQLRGLLAAQPITIRPLALIAVPALVAHGLAAFWAIDTPAGINLGLYTSLSLVTWVMGVCLMLMAFYLPVANLLVLVFPLATVGVIAALVGDTSFTPLTDLSTALKVHILISIAAYSILFMGACQAIALGVLEHYLKSKRAMGRVRLLPPLQTMEALLFSLLWIGLVALTLAIGSGFLFLDNLFAQHVVHHTVLACASWVVYAALLAGHRLFGWRGTTAVRWALIAFLLLVMGYFGSKFVIEILLNR